MALHTIKEIRYGHDLHIVGHADMRIISIGSGAFGLSIDINRVQEVIDAMQAALADVQEADAVAAELTAELAANNPDPYLQTR
jgi:poly-beta-hydroxyalkanoate depolymerase